MSNQAVEASKTLKTIGNEITQWENRLEYVKTEVQKNTQTRDALSEQIARKTQDFDVYMAQKDAEVKKAYADMLVDREQLMQDKKDFKAVLEQHRKDKADFDNGNRDLQIERMKHEANVKNVQEFITAVRRAVGLLGI